MSKNEKEVKEMFSQIDLDRLLGGATSSAKDIEDRHNQIQALIKGASQQIFKAMDIIEQESSIVLHTIQTSEEDNLNSQRLLGEYYELLNDCHTKLNHLTDLSKRELGIYQRRIRVKK